MEAEIRTTAAPATCVSALAKLTLVSQAKIAEGGFDYVTPEFEIGLFEENTQNLFISLLGILTLTNGQGAGLSFDQDMPTSQVDPLAIFAYWDSIEPRNGEYDITHKHANDPSFGRVLIVNYCLYSTAASTIPNHFTITFMRVSKATSVSVTTNPRIREVLIQ
ncbi:uncharacterized protein FTOL_02340 [Fusarium torulosum]|uniref:Uncharacterized protein n=1 Tax=Fusarium torulosum TaxID=33205 RepID=A0AAE8M1M9_9HYPO|nr:uncharacterized protein FTOL_02340 [Fusarium torulosum]